VTGPPVSTSAWHPLRNPLFRGFWIASLVSNVGTWMHTTAAAWVMTGLSPSPLLVSLMQTAASLPFFLLALPAGALADVVDRRRVLFWTQLAMFFVAALLGYLSVAGLLTAWTLLALTFALGIGAALNAPAWQAALPDLIDRDELPAAVALGGVSLNLARAVGPALGGLVLGALGAAPVFWLNAASFLAVVFVVHRWERDAAAGRLPPEHLVGAMSAGLRYALNDPRLRSVLWREALFIAPASALWALLPVVAREALGLDAVGYGSLLACLGVGAVTGAIVLPRVRERLGVDRLLAVATALFAATTVVLAVGTNEVLVGIALFFGGVGWIALMSSVNVASQHAVPAWVRARALALTLLVLQGGLAGGSALWGALAASHGTSIALVAAAAALVGGLVVASRFSLGALEGLDLRPSMHWPEPQLSGEPDPDGGPVLVTVEYRIDPARADEFVRMMDGIAHTRRRDGAISWHLYRDASDVERFVETFVVGSWLEHQRQHERVTMTDRELETAVRRLHIGTDPPAVTHLLSVTALQSRGR
jgi:MFS family permease